MGVTLTSPTNSKAFRKFKLPPQLIDKMGRDTIHRGKWPTGDPEGYNLVFWDHLEECREIECPLRPCTYARNSEKKAMPISGIRWKWCLLQKYYLRAVITSALQLMEVSGPDWDKVVVIGFNLVPLYNNLWRHKMEMLRLDGWSRDPEDSSRVHPVYREFRKTCDSIDRHWGRIAQRRKGGKKCIPKPPTVQEEYLEALMGKPQTPKRTKGKDMKEGTGAKF